MSETPRRYSADELRLAAEVIETRAFDAMAMDLGAMIFQAAEDASRLEQIEQVAQRVVGETMKARGPYDWITCMVCGDLFRPPARHPIHHSCPVYELQEFLSSSAGRREEMT